MVAANIGSLLAVEGRRIGVVDANLESPALAMLFGLDETTMSRSFNDYLRGKCDIEQAVYDVTRRLNADIAGRLFLIPTTTPSFQTLGMQRQNYDLKLFDEGFQTLIAELELDALIIDTHAGLHEESLILMALSDVLAILLRRSQQDYQVTSVMVDIAHRLNVPRVVLIGTEELASFDDAHVKAQIELAFDCSVAAILPHSDELLALAGADIFVLRYPDHPLTVAFKQIAMAVIT